MTRAITEPGARPGRSSGRARVVLLICALAAAGLGLGLKCPALFPGLETPGFKVTRVMGLETLEVEVTAKSSYSPAEYHAVRLQGFEPAADQETQAELSRAMNEMLLNKRVHLEYDQPGHPWEAEHGEWLAYVFLDDKLVNAELLRRGLGRFSMNWSPIRHVNELRRAESEAGTAQRGMWGRIEQGG